MGKINLCYGCGLAIKNLKQHYHREITVPGQPSCYKLNRMRISRESAAVLRNQGAALNHGVELGSANKELRARLAPLVIRSHHEVAKILGISKERSRQIEMKALEKIRKFLMPFRGAISGDAKVKQVTMPIPSLAD